MTVSRLIFRNARNVDKRTNRFSNSISMRKQTIPTRPGTLGLVVYTTGIAAMTIDDTPIHVRFLDTVMLRWHHY